MPVVTRPVFNAAHEHGNTTERIGSQNNRASTLAELRETTAIASHKNPPTTAARRYESKRHMSRECLTVEGRSPECPLAARCGDDGRGAPHTVQTVALSSPVVAHFGQNAIRLKDVGPAAPKAVASGPTG
jgi:hypothetical protein